MTPKTLALAALFAVALSACSPPATHDGAKHDAEPPVVAAEAPAALAKGRGEVVVLQPEYGAVTIRHEAIPEYGMGPMTMEFTTANAAQLKDLKVGDKVTFDLKAATEIEKIQVEKK